jgi:hypothetical protein
VVSIEKEKVTKENDKALIEEEATLKIATEASTLKANAEHDLA